MQCGSVRGACSASLGVLRDALADAPFLPVRRQPRADQPERQMPFARSVLAQMWSGSWRRCGGSQSQLSFGSPAADVGSPVQLAAVAPMQAACARERCSVGLHSRADRVTAHVVGRCADGRTPPVSAAHGGGGVAGPLPVHGVRRRRSPCRRRQRRGSRTVAPLPPPLPVGVAPDAPHAPDSACLAICSAIAAHALPRVIVHAEDCVWPHAERMLLALMRSREGARVLPPLIRLQTLSIGRADTPDSCASSAEAARRATRLLCNVDSGSC